MSGSNYHSPENQNLPATAKCSWPRARSGSFRAKSVRKLELAATRLHIPSFCHDDSQLHGTPEKRTNSSRANIMSQSNQRGVSIATYNSMDNHTTPQLTISNDHVEGGGALVRRRVSPDKQKMFLKGPGSPDRFIPSRRSIYPSSTPFRISKVPQLLSPEEKLRRKHSPSADPFMPSRPRRSTVPRSARGQIGRSHSLHYGPHLVNDSTITGNNIRSEIDGSPRQVSSGAVWNVGGSSAVTGRPPTAIPDGTGGLHSSGTTAPMHVADFMKQKPSVADEREKFESRIALALDIDPTTRLLNTSTPSPLLESSPSPSSPDYEQLSPFTWKDNAWRKGEKAQWPLAVEKDHGETVPTMPFRVLDAPRLRDDFYCSPIAYCSNTGILAVSLAHEVYLWTEDYGVHYPPFSSGLQEDYVTSLSFSSESGGRSILAIGVRSGVVFLWSTYELGCRFAVPHQKSVSCVAFKPTTTRRISERRSDMEADAEDLAVGDEAGNVWYYSLEWPDKKRSNWGGSIVLLARISAHTQQICNLAWSPDDAYLATGGNDNACLLFELRDVLPPRDNDVPAQPLPNVTTRCQNAFSCLALSPRRLFNRRNILSQLLPSWAYSEPKPSPSSTSEYSGSLVCEEEKAFVLNLNRCKHRLAHSAAVKAIAFAPWQPSLLATGGGSNDQAIHFFHTQSGACLATINVNAQVTSLIWSKNRPEIAATFGFAQPEHTIRIAVFAWPSCEQVTAIPWGPRGTSADGTLNEDTGDCGRIIWAIGFPGCSCGSEQDMYDDDTVIDGGRDQGRRCRRRNALEPVRPKEKEGGLWCSRTLEEGCIVVASSDQTVKFHEVWSGPRKTVAATCGLFGGSEILEELEGIENPKKEIIR